MNGLWIVGRTRVRIQEGALLGEEFRLPPVEIPWHLSLPLGPFPAYEIIPQVSSEPLPSQALGFIGEREYVLPTRLAKLAY